MARNNEVETKAIAWLNDKGKLLTCAACGVRQWNIDDPLSVPRSKGQLSGIPQSPPDKHVLTIVPLICAKCGYIAFVKATDMKLDVPEQE
jgi:hypothetical protein